MGDDLAVFVDMTSSPNVVEVAGGRTSTQSSCASASRGPVPVSGSSRPHGHLPAMCASLQGVRLVWNSVVSTTPRVCRDPPRRKRGSCCRRAYSGHQRKVLVALQRRELAGLRGKSSVNSGSAAAAATGAVSIRNNAAARMAISFSVSGGETQIPAESFALRVAKDFRRCSVKDNDGPGQIATR